MKHSLLRRSLLACALLFGSLTLAQSGAEQAKRQARSVHLTYRDWPRAATVLYNEVTVEAAYPGSYFCVMAFNGGYGGIQMLPDGSPYLIFSVWDKGDAEKNAKAVQRVRHDYAGAGVEVARFGGEGTGGRAMAQWPWRVGQRIRYAVSTVPGEAGETAYTGWIWDDEKGAWFRIATFSSRVNTAKSLLTGCYSFVEDFLRNVESRDHVRKASFGMLWSYGEQGWQAAGGGSFSGDANTLTTIDCGASGADIWLQTGGQTVQHTALNAKLKPEAAPDPAQSAPYREALLAAVAETSGQWADALVLGGKRLSPWAAHKAGIPEEIAGVKVTRFQASDGLGARFTLEATGPKSVKTGPLTLLSDLPGATLTGVPGRPMVRSQGRLYTLNHPQASAWLGEATLPMGSTNWDRQDCAIGSRVVGIGNAPAGTTYRVTFTYRKGRDHLRIHSVRLIDGQGRTVVADEHAGKAGCAHADNVYALTAPCDVPDAQLLLSYGNREVPDSYGLITFEQVLPGYGFLGFPEGFTLAPGKPVSFVLTSQPLSGEPELRLDGLLPGDPGAPVEAKVTRKAGKTTIALTAREAVKVQTLDLAAFAEGSVTEAAGVETFTAAWKLSGPGAHAERLADVAGLWTPREVSNMAQCVPVGPVNAGERWQVAFHYLSGRVSVRPLWVDLIDDADHVVARDEHDGKAGYKREAADYLLAAPKDIENALFFVRYDTQEGSSTRGLILCTRQGQPGPALLWAKPGTLKPGKTVTYTLSSTSLAAREVSPLLCPSGPCRLHPKRAGAPSASPVTPPPRVWPIARRPPGWCAKGRSLGVGCALPPKWWTLAPIAAGSIR